MSRTPGFIFDMDGTMMDSITAWHESELKILEEVGIALTKEQRDEVNTLTLEEAGAFFHDRFGVKSSGEEVVQAIMDHMLAFYRTRAEANPGIVRFLEAVCGEGAPLCVLSSSPQEFLQVGLAHAGLRDFFEEGRIISVEDLDTTKRDSATYGHVCGLLGRAPADTWFFDDSWYALATAQSFGVRTVGVFSTDNCGTHEELARYAERVVDAFDELDPADFL